MTTGQLATREAILKAQDRPHEDVAVPEWGNLVVRIKALSGLERDNFEASVATRHGKSVEVDLANVRAKLVACTAVDAEGRRLFSEDDVVALGQKSAAALDRLFAVAQRLSGMSDQDAKELAQGFKTAQSAGSTSA